MHQALQSVYLCLSFKQSDAAGRQGKDRLHVSVVGVNYFCPSGTSVGTQGCTFCSYATSSETAAVAATSTTRAEATIKETAGFIRPNSINHHITSQLRRYDFLFPFSFRKKKHCCSVCLLNGEEASGQIILSQGLRGSFF